MDSKSFFRYLINHSKGPRGGLIAKFPAIKALESLDGLKDLELLDIYPDEVSSLKVEYQARASNKEAYSNIETVLYKKALKKVKVIRHPISVNSGKPDEHISTLFRILNPKYNGNDPICRGLEWIKVDLEVYNPKHKP